MSFLVRLLRARPQLFVALALGVLASQLPTPTFSLATRALVGWNVGVWLYLAAMLSLMLRADHARMRRVAVAHAEGAVTVLSFVSIAAIVSLGATVYELSAAKASDPGARHAAMHLAFALATVVGSWLLVPMMFTLRYASLYYHRGGGLQFPAPEGAAFKPDYGDFAYFAFTIAVASQTADVTIDSATMRRHVLLQSILSFVFNTTILAFMINIAASLF